MPLLVFALLFVLFLGVLLILSYFAIAIVFKVSKVLLRGLMSFSPLPNAISRSLREARHYAELIKKTARQYPPGPVQDRLVRTVKPVDEWLVNLNRLEQALVKLYSQRNIPRELRRTTSEIEHLRRQLLMVDKQETASLKDLINSKRKYLAVLKELNTFQNQAEFKIHKIASDLGTTHSEMLLVTARGNFKDQRFQRLDESLEENLSGLRDILTAMDEMGYSSQATGY